MKQPSEEEIFEKVDTAFNTLDKERLAGLERISLMHNIRDQAQQQEKARLTAKYGEDHPRVTKISNRLQYNQGARLELDYEIEKSKITLPDIDSNTWLVHGRVLDQDRKGVPDMTVSLYDENGQWVEELGHACTDERGYFALRYQVKDKKPDVPETQPLYLTVTDEQQKIRHRETEPLYGAIGLMDYRLIILGEEDGTCTPPQPGVDVPADAWVVTGTVSDENSKPLPSLVVRLYDKEMVFADKLGSALTDASGCFSMTYNREEFGALFEKKPDLYLKVQDRSGQELYNSTKAVQCEAGKVEKFKIVIKSKGATKQK